MLKRIRIITGALFFILLTFLLVDFTGLAHHWFGWMAKVQLVPAILAVNGVVVGVLLLLTLLLGRIYCSVICPLGVFQDVVSWTAGKTRRKKNRFRYSPALSWLRWGMLALFVASLLANIVLVTGILEPYSAYGRMATNLFAPLYRWGNNLLAFFAERVDSYAFYSTDVWIKTGAAFAVAVLTFLVIGFLAWRHGRTWCNTICPVGTLLGFLSRYSLFRPVIDPEKCTKCSLCSRNCKASCIDYQHYQIDHSRCVTCMNCLGQCKFDAISYSTRRPVKKTVPVETAPTEEEGGISRRGFLSIAATVAVSKTVQAQHMVADGGLAVIEDKKIPKRDTPIVPPGAGSAKHLKQHCTACQLCVSACPNKILRPSGKLATLMQPEMSYERGYCRPECTRCSEVCPNDAIKRVTEEEKSSIQIGRAVWISQNCIVNRDNESCTNCERHCPTKAITLVHRERDNPDSLKIPVVETELCIGCGACENLCPARPFSAIYVEGNQIHRTI